MSLRLFPLLFLAALWGLCGCSGPKYVSVYGASCPHNLDTQLRLLDMKGVFDGMARELCSTPTSELPSTVMVTDFVDLDSFEPEESGIVMGELLRGSLNKMCGYRIQQAELGRNVTLGSKGLAALTRRGDFVQSDEAANANLVVGTFSYSKEKLLIFAKKFKKNSNVTTMVSSREINFACKDWGTDFSLH